MNQRSFASFEVLRVLPRERLSDRENGAARAALHDTLEHRYDLKCSAWIHDLFARVGEQRFRLAVPLGNVASVAIALIVMPDGRCRLQMLGCGQPTTH